jgi:hypothetical protein
MNKYIISTTTAGEKYTRTLKDARKIAREMARDIDLPPWDRPRIFRYLGGCAGTDCCCGGLIHPQRKEINW